jgi:DNA-binding XRE family transcriptional regulator
MDPEDSDPLSFDPEELLEKLLHPELGASESVVEAVAALKRLQQLPKDSGLQDLLPKTRSKSQRPRLESPADQKPRPDKRESRRETLADLVKAYRADNGLTQMEFPHISSKTISRIEHGSLPSPKILAQLAADMNMKPSELPKR